MGERSFGSMTVVRESIDNSSVSTLPESTSTAFLLSLDSGSVEPIARLPAAEARGGDVTPWYI
tara:strand:- start:488 stop:676 length:189 start_codon:yes stop_codon:yes gene_type:complete